MSFLRPCFLRPFLVLPLLGTRALALFRATWNIAEIPASTPLTLRLTLFIHYDTSPPQNLIIGRLLWPLW